ncbi:MAG: tetratricopeptide repeat protein [Terracidiphilus sp.]
MVSGSPELLLERGRIAKRERRLEDAMDLFRRALTESSAGDNRALCATLLEELAYVERNLRELEAAEAHYRASAEIYRSLGNPLKAAHTVRHAADILREQNKPEQAASLYAESLAIYRTHKETSPLDLANAIRGFALLKEKTGDLEQAFRLWSEASELYGLTGIDAGVSECRARIESLFG